MREFSLEFPMNAHVSVQWPSNEPIKSVLVVGHGALAERQKPTYEHWLSQNVEVHCADVDPFKLEDCLNGIHRHILPQDEAEMLSAAPFDLLCVSNIPELHLITALQYGTYARRIIIQKPQDLNYPLIRTIAEANGPDRFRLKTVIHDHYRNKSAVAALMRGLPQLLQDYGKFRRLMFFLTEARSVYDEPHRAASLECGMIQDLAVHQVDVMLECLMTANEWRVKESDERLHRRVGCMIEIMNCVKLVDQNSILGDDIETCAVIDLRVTEDIEFPAAHPNARRFKHTFDVLIVVGKGLAIEQGIVRDLKAVVVEFERPEFYAVVDLATQGVRGISNEGINRHHGGMNRPLMLISPNPPEHALRGLGGLGYPLWQNIPFGQYVASIAEGAKSWYQPQRIAAYPSQRPLGDLIRELASPRLDQIRNSVWSGLPPLTNFQVEEIRPSPYFD